MVLNVFSGVEGLQRRRNGFQMVLAKAEKRNGLYFAAESHSALNTHKYLSPFQVVKFTYMFEAFFDTKKVTIFTMSKYTEVLSVFNHEFFHLCEMAWLLHNISI